MEERHLTWRKSSRSGTQGDCVEVAETRDQVLIRDSKDPDGPVVAVSPEDFARFIRSVAS